ncbi:uncharacterized protein LOC125672881 isoform X2 [Ostrea edulis]|uniref:uncharacterized protein LOC125672881 isoform X2 n=1 Tax=Ostrea edulis TaxID=37623 RepID=UPI0024AECEC9|nr:uncharacterized protein LOC125672881 isoform X2 [Ostrea edulis]
MVFVGSPLTDVYLYMSVGYPVSYHSFDVTEKESTAEGTVKNKVEDHVNRFYDVYEYAAAYKASKRARTFAFISFLLGLVMWILILTLWKVRFR